jgi:hypothetical protein
LSADEFERYIVSSKVSECLRKFYECLALFLSVT